MPMRDAALVALNYMERVYPEEPKRMVEWKRLAKALRIPMIENPELHRERIRREQAKVRAEFGGDE